MFIQRYEGEFSIQEAPETTHYKKLLKKIKKRQLKKQGTVDINISSKKRKVSHEKGDEISTKDAPQVEKFLKNKVVNTETFTIIGDHTFRENDKVNAVLPKWLSQPELIFTDLTQATSDLPELNDRIMSNLKEEYNISQFFPVQQAVIPLIMNQSKKRSLVYSNYISQDVCVSSPTGSGKSLAYILPIVQDLFNRLVPRIRCLVVVPVQELAEQVANVFRTCMKGTTLKVEAITGGKSPLHVEQDRLLKKIRGFQCSTESLVDIVVTTPGRLVEHLQKTKGFNLKYLKYLVIDEADRIIDGIQNDWLFYLENHLGQKLFSTLSLNYLRRKSTMLQKLLFSATLSQDPEKLRKLNLFQPILFTSTEKDKNQIIELTKNKNDGKEDINEFVGKFMMPKELEEYYTVVENYLKPLAIAELLSVYKWRMVLCFCKSASEAQRLAKLISFLCPTLTVRDISSVLHRTSRNLVLKQFSNGEIDMLVSTDLMARGIDIPQVRYVISYDPPKYLRGYVHRAGRTGRAGVKGTVLTLTTKTQVVPFIQRLKEANRINITEIKMGSEVFKKKSKSFKVALVKLKNFEESREKCQLKRKKNTRRKKKTK